MYPILTPPIVKARRGYFYTIVSTDAVLPVPYPWCAMICRKGLRAPESNGPPALFMQAAAEAIAAPDNSYDAVSSYTLGVLASIRYVTCLKCSRRYSCTLG